MHRIWQEFVIAAGFSFILIYGSVWERDAVAKDSPSSSSQGGGMASAAKQCPTNLSFLQPKMEKALQFIKSAKFREAMLASLQASIPQAITQADGLAQQIFFLKQEIARQEKEGAHAEKVAREGLKDPSQELKPCRHGKEGAYCYAMEQYLVSRAANMANQEFLNALLCYQREGMR